MASSSSLKAPIKEGIFLAPKDYLLIRYEGDKITKHKGPGKAEVDEEWYVNMLANPYHKMQIKYIQNFHRNWKQLLIEQIFATHTLGLGSTKRELVFTKGKGKDRQWIGTKPHHIGDGDVKSINPTSYKLILNLLEENEDLRKEFSQSDLMIDDKNHPVNKKNKASKNKKADKPGKKGDNK